MIRIITDESWDLPAAIAQNYDIDVLPISLTDENDRPYRVGEDLSLDEFYAKQRAGSNFKTAQVSPARVQAAFEEAAQAGQPALFIPLSSGISGTFANASVVRDQVLEAHPQAQLAVLDSKSATIGHGLLVLRARQLAQAGWTLDQIVQALDQEAQVQEHLFTVGSLDYLHRGGRVSKGVQLMGGLLKIMPLMHVDKADGSLQLLEPVRGKKHLFKKYQEHMLKKSPDLDRDQTVGIVHGDWPDMFQQMRDFLIHDLGFAPENILESRIGAVIGAHTGPEVIALSFLSQPGLAQARLEGDLGQEVRDPQA